MQNIWVVSGPTSGGVALREYFPSQQGASVRAESLAKDARAESESLSERVDLDVTWDQYREIHDLRWDVDEVPDSASLNSDDDAVNPTGPSPSGRIWIALSGGHPEADRGYVHSEGEARDAAWDRKWARWETYTSSTESDSVTFAQYRSTRVDAVIDYAPVDPGPQA